MKKGIFISSIVLFILMFSQCVMAEQVPSDKVGEFLVKTGFVTQEQVENPEDGITRGDFADIVVSLMGGVARTYGAQEQLFADVPPDDKRYKSIMYLSECNIVNGVDAIRFDPDSLIQYDDACTIVVRVLGLDFMSEDMPYYEIAGRYKITDGIKSDGEKLTRGMALRMIYNALTASIDVEYDVGSFTYGSSQPLLEKRFEIYSASGIVSDDGRTALTGKSAVKSGYIVINNKIYKNDSGEDNSLGCNTVMYYKEIDGVETAVYLLVSDGKNRIEHYTNEDLDSYSAGEYKVYSNKDKSKTSVRRLAADYKFIYNTQAVTGGIDSKDINKYMCPDVGNVTLIDNNKDGVFDVVIVESYQTIIVNGFSKETQTLYSKYKNPESISFDNFDIVEAVDTKGAYMNIDSVADFNVVSVMKSIYKDYAKIIISQEFVTGKIESYKSSGHIVEIDGEEYELADDLVDLIEIPQIGSQIKAYLRHDKKIAYITVQSDESKGIVYLKNAALTDGFGDELQIKVFTANKDVKTMKLSKKVKLDGISFKNAEKALEYIRSLDAGINNLVLIKQNKDEEVVSIDFPYRDGKYNEFEDKVSWHIAEDLYQVNKKIGQSIIDGKIGVNESTVIFIVPENGDLTEATIAGIYSATVSEYEAKYKYSVYTIDDSKMLADAIVVYRDAAGFDLDNSDVATRRPRMIVTEVNTEYNEENGELCLALTVTNGAYPTKVYTKTIQGGICKKSGRQVQVGDIIRYGTDKSERIPDGQLVICYSPAYDRETLLYDSGSFDGAPHKMFGNKWMYGTVMGKAYEMNEKYIRIHNTGKGILGKMDEIRLFSLSSMKYVVYDSERERVELGDWTDIVPETVDPNNTDIHIFDYNEGSISYIYIIK